MSRRSFIGALALLLVANASPGAAHAILVESRPAASSTVEAGPIIVRLRYNSRIDKARSRLTLVRPDKGSEVVHLAEGGAADVLEATLRLAAGKYTLRWQVLAVDGHITRGDLPFTVHGPAGK